MEISADKSPALTRCSALGPHFAFHTFQDRASWCNQTQQRLQLIWPSVQIPWFTLAIIGLGIRTLTCFFLEIIWAQHALIGSKESYVIAQKQIIVLCRSSHYYSFGFFCFNCWWFSYLCYFSWAPWLEYKGTLVGLLKQNPQWRNNNSALSPFPLVMINSS